MIFAARAVGLSLIAALLLAAWPTAQSQGLTASSQIARIYDAILDARFEQVPELLDQTCGPAVGRPAVNAPRPHPAVCQLLDVVSLWWQIQINPADTSRDADFERRVSAAISAAEAWTVADPGSAEAWFYLGGAYGARGQLRVLRGQPLSAARDGKRIKDALERALARDPQLKDAYFGIGLYHYYADVAPAAAKILRFLLLLPGGDKVQGMREMLQARDGGQLLRGEADYQLHVLYLWYEHQPERARDVIGSLAERYPRNPHFPQLIAEITDQYLHDDTGTLRAWRSMLAAAQGGRLALRSMAETRSRLGIATQLDRLHETDLALEPLDALIAARPSAPFGALAQALLLRGHALDRLGSRAEAVSAYTKALDTLPPGDPLKIATAARAGLRTAPDVDTARAYRLSLEGWRAFERGAIADAARLLAQSRRIRPRDPVSTYRHAKILLAQNDARAALPLFDAVIRARENTPTTFYAYACVEAAALYAQMGDRMKAAVLYGDAVDVYGADQRTKDIARRALMQLSAP